jgi:2-dehydropantoate 2-reductase
MDDYVLDSTKSTVLQDWIRGRHCEVDEIHGAVLSALGEGQAPINAAMIEVAHRIEKGDLPRDESNLETLLALAAEA